MVKACLRPVVGVIALLSGATGARWGAGDVVA
jgi:hypothetical protein